MSWLSRLFGGSKVKSNGGAPIKEKPRQDFVDCGDGTVADSAANLMWQKIHALEKMTQPQAIAYCQSLDLAGHGNWRLPTLEDFRELRNNRDSAVEMSKPGDVCWTGSDLSGGPSNVALASDGTSFYRTEKFYVRAVRNI